LFTLQNWLVKGARKNSRKLRNNAEENQFERLDETSEGAGDLIELGQLANQMRHSQRHRMGLNHGSGQKLNDDWQGRSPENTNNGDEEQL
jgi:hypothetical protein